jgi:hypothetical protein
MITTVCKDVERFQPQCWDHIVGNQQLKEYFWDMIWCVRKEGHRSGFNLLTTGESRCGKTATVSFGVKCLGCYDLDFETMNPCGKCANCTMNHHLYGNEGWEGFADWLSEEEAPTPIRYHYMPIDCTRLSESDLEDCLTKIRISDDNLRIIYLDEVHRLSRRFMDERLLKPIEDYPAIWIASSANVRKDDVDDTSKLDKMFQNRFSFRINIQKPSADELTAWLAKRCAELGIQCEKARETLRHLAQRSNRNTGMALQVLNRAHKKRSKILTVEMVDDHVFDFND